MHEAALVEQRLNLSLSGVKIAASFTATINRTLNLSASIISRHSQPLTASKVAVVIKSKNRYLRIIIINSITDRFCHAQSYISLSI